MKVLVTGHQGYIGTVLVPMLRRGGHEVAGLDSRLFTRGNLGPAPEEIPSLTMDVRDVEVAHLRGFDAVIHLAGISNDPLGDLNADCTYDVNHLASVRLARLAKEAGVGRFLFASSCSLYGAAGDLEMVDEQAAFNPVTPYGSSKILVESDVQAMADDSFCPTYLRCATVYGYSPRLRADLVVNNLVGYALLQSEVFLKSDGSPWRPLVHVEDVARAYRAILEAPRRKVHNQAFNVGRTTENYQVRDVARLVQQHVPRSVLRLAEGAGPDTRCYKVDCRKLETTLPTYQPQWTVEAGIMQLRQAYEEHGLTMEDFLGPAYLRIKQIEAYQREGRLDRSLRWVPEETQPIAQRSDTLHSDTAACRSCGSHHREEILSLGEMPLADGLLSDEQLSHDEPRFPLTVLFCPDCSLVQIRENVPPQQLFGDDYPYYSSFSESWMQHCEENAHELIESRALDASSLVIEIASNDGYMLRNFQKQGIPVLGIDPVKGPSDVAERSGIRVRREFFTKRLAEELNAEGTRADVVIANNVLAHVPDLPGFVAGVRHALKDDGVAVFEVPYVGDMIERCEFDTIYHEHHCYFSVTALHKLFSRAGLFLTEVRRLPTHGGSLRLYVERHAKANRPSGSVEHLLREEHEQGIDQLDYYCDFARRVEEIQDELLQLLHELKGAGNRVVGYAAAAKGTMLLNSTGIGRDLLDYVVDRNRHKHGKTIPGVRLPICNTSRLLQDMPDYVLLLAWNHKDEIFRQQAEYLRRGGRIIVPIPRLEVVSCQGDSLVAAASEELS
ncbi:MAG TPA: NAD-dependent epimerase/dehydratase family protein [Thermoguttaceae bacterium]|nr:NAD-dependent epimerase/dehydratase family protein [Thermoguttaceae bacterium]